MILHTDEGKENHHDKIYECRDRNRNAPRRRGILESIAA